MYCIIVPWLEDSYSYYYDDSEQDTMQTIYNIEIRLVSVGQFFDLVATALLLITLVEIGNGFLYILTQTRTGLQKGLRWATVSAAGVIVVLAIALLGQTNVFWSAYFNYQAGNGRSMDFVKESRTLNQLSGAVIILCWVMTLPLIAFASYVVHRVKGIPLLRSVSSKSPIHGLAQPD